MLRLLLTVRSFLLTVGLFHLRWFALVIRTYSRNSVWSSLLTVETWSGLFYLRLRHRKYKR